MKTARPTSLLTRTQLDQIVYDCGLSCTPRDIARAIEAALVIAQSVQPSTDIEPIIIRIEKACLKWGSEVLPTECRTGWYKDVREALAAGITRQ